MFYFWISILGTEGSIELWYPSRWHGEPFYVILGTTGCLRFRVTWICLLEIYNLVRHVAARALANMR